MSDLAARVDLRTMASCCVQAAQHVGHVGRPGDTAECSVCGSLLTVSQDGRWSLEFR